MKQLLLAAAASACLLAPTPSSAECWKDPKYLAECQPLMKAASNDMCQPERLYTNSVKGSTAWQEAVRDAPKLEQRYKDFAAKYPQCIDEKDAKKCVIRSKVLKQCSGLPKKYDAAWASKVKEAKKEVMGWLPTLERKAKEDPKEGFATFRNAQKYLAKVFGSVLWVEQNNKEFLGYKKKLRELRKVFIAANMDAIAKVKCPKAGHKNPKLAKTLMKTYKAWLKGLTYKVKPHALRMARSVIKETDWRGTKWEYGYTTTCIEDLSDKSDPARCSVNEVSFKRSKPRGKGWSQWSFHGHGARDDAMLCKNAK